MPSLVAWPSLLLFSIDWKMRGALEHDTVRWRFMPDAPAQPPEMRSRVSAEHPPHRRGGPLQARAGGRSSPGGIPRRAQGSWRLVRFRTEGGIRPAASGSEPPCLDLESGPRYWYCKAPRT